MDSGAFRYNLDSVFTEVTTFYRFCSYCLCGGRGVTFKHWPCRGRSGQRLRGLEDAGRKDGWCENNTGVDTFFVHRYNFPQFLLLLEPVPDHNFSPGTIEPPEPGRVSQKV